MRKLGRLTIGIISKDGQPFIEDCLQSFSSASPLLLNHFDSIEFILVDSNSSDNTLGCMIGFSRKNKLLSIKTDVYLIEGYCNAAIARNIILENCKGNLIFLCDGDIIINYKFLILASEKITGGRADAVKGQLSEKWYDSKFNFYKSIPVREKITHEQIVRITGGLIFLSEKVVQSNIKYDEQLRRNEDRDFALRISDTFKILAIPIFVGTHLTQPYYSNERFGIFIKENYNKFIGTLLRKHIFSLRNLLEIAKAELGVFIGFIHIILFTLSLILCLFQVYTPFLLVLLIIFIDLIRDLRKHPIKRFIIYRFISPIMVVQGFFFPTEELRSYSINKVNTNT